MACSECSTQPRCLLSFAQWAWLFDMDQDKLRPLAIVGLSFRFPGQANTTPGFWDVLSNGKSTRTKIPTERFNPDSFYHPSPDRQGAVITTEGCFMKDDPGLFDAPFFSITAAEADGMDPQQRLLLEVTYEALENAGMPIKNVAGSQTGCYVGGFSSDYDAVSGVEINYMSSYQAIGCGNSMLANRLSWFYDFRGPSYAIDTACSSSMVALHEACRELQDGSSGMAVVAGTSLMLIPSVWRGLSAQRFLSPDGACHSFDDRANGYGRGEGIGVLIIKPLDDALRDGDVIRAVIRGSGMNQDGHTPAITVPSAEAQMSLIQTTYDRAGLDFKQTSYFEAHGTGTPVGDPLELLAIGKTIGAARQELGGPVIVGSVKSNIGHLEGSSGVAGVIKAVLALENGAIPAVAEFENPNPRLRLDEWNLQIPKELTAWPSPGLRRVSINSFGYGGSNAHVILDDALHYLEARNLVGNHNTSPGTLARSGTPLSVSTDSGVSVGKDDEQKPSSTHKRVFVFSSPEQEALTRLAETYADHLRHNVESTSKDKTEELLSNLAFTLSQRRSIFDWRSFAVADSITGLQTILEARLPKLGRVARDPSAAFVFTGQGAQWFAMGRELRVYAVFQESLAQADVFLRSLGSPWSALEELLERDKATSRINEPQLSQPLCTALQIALVDLLTHWGLRPKAVVGHSSGEIGAAYAAGVLSRQDALKAAYWRGVRSAEINELSPDRRGSMMAVALSEETAQQYLDRVQNGKVIVACINSPSSVTISGDESAVAEVEVLLKADNIFARKLLVKTAYHSEHMRVVAKPYLNDILDIVPRNASSGITIFSSVTGAEIQGEEMGPEYWVKNLLSPVRFSDAVAQLLKPVDSRNRRKGLANVQAIVEAGPHAALQGPLRDIMAAESESYLNSVSYVSMLQRGSDATDTALNSAGRLWAMGFDVDLSLVNSTDATPVSAQPLVNLPRYPFNHKKRYWHEARNINWRYSQEQGRSDLLGSPITDYNTVFPIWKNYLTPAEVPWLLDHRVHNLLVLPGAVYIVMVLEACRNTADTTRTVLGYEFRDIFWHKPIVFETESSIVETQCQLSPAPLGTKNNTATWTSFSVSTIGPDSLASLHCSGLVKIKYATKAGEIDQGKEAELQYEGFKSKFSDIRASPTMELNVGSTYDKLNSYGLQFGPTFRNLMDLHAGEGFGYCDLEVPDTAAYMAEGYECPLPIHPVMLDAVFQMLTITSHTGGAGAPVAMLPNSIEGLYIKATTPTEPGSVLKGYVTRRPKNMTQQLGNMVISDAEWNEPLIVLTDLTVTATAKPGQGTSTIPFSRLDWVADVRRSNVSLAPEITDGDIATATAESDNTTTKEFVQKAQTAPTENSASERMMSHYKQWLPRRLAVTTALTDAQSAALPTIDALEAAAASTDNEKGLSSFLPEEFIDDFATISLGRSFADTVVVDILDRAGYVNPNIEILQIGRDTSISCAAAVLARLGGNYSRLSRYVLTARDSTLLAEVATTLARFSSLELKSLDIELGLESQEAFNTGGRFDYIVLDDLTFSTQNMESALDNIKRLLKPAGKLVIQAITSKQPRTGSALEPVSVRLDELAWNALLEKSGFTGVEQVIQRSGDPKLHQVSVMVSTIIQSVEYPSSEVILLMPSTPSSDLSHFAETFTQALHDRSLNVTAAAWDTVEDWSGKLLISFLEFDGPLLINMSEHIFDAVKAMSLRSTGMLWVTRAGLRSGAHPSYSVSLGMFRAIRSEDENLRLMSIDLSPETDLSSARATDTVLKVFDTLSGDKDLHPPMDREFVEQGGVIYIQRLVEDEGLSSQQAQVGGPGSSLPPVTDRLFQEDRRLKLSIGQIGALDSLQYVDNAKFLLPLPRDYVEVKVVCTGLNFLDVMASLGEVPDPTLGSEVVGIVTALGSDVTRFEIGQTVVGTCRDGFGSHVRMKHTIPQPIPSHMSTEEAASVPVAFMTSWMALVGEAKIHEGETILIHAGAGGVGQAAIQIAQHFGLEVYTTVGSTGKKELLMERYGIPADHIFSSRDASFAQGIRRATGGRGVDLVLNSLAGELLRQSWHLVADFGRFVEIGKRDILGNTGLDMEPFLRSVSFIGFNLDKYKESLTEFVECEDAMQHIFELLAAKKFRAIHPISVFDYNDVTTAMRLLQSGKVQGKIVLRAQPDQLVPVVPRVKHPLVLDPKATYLLSGGLGGIGRSIAAMLRANGAKNLAFISRSGDSKPSSQVFLDQLKNLGCNARAYACDISDRSQLVEALEMCSAELPPIKGLIQCAMFLKDGIFENMSYDDWVSCTGPKIHGSWNLHDLLPDSLDFFIMLASTAGLIGNPGQANYAAGNTFEDALAHHRRRLGLNATAIDLGAVRDVGYLAEAGDDRYWNMSHLNSLMITEADVHFLIKTAITGYSAGDKETPVQVVSGLSGAAMDNTQVQRSQWALDGKLSIVLKASINSVSADTEADIEEALKKVDSVAGAVAIVEEVIAKRVAMAVMVPEEDISLTELLQTYGVNSLVAVEIRTWLTKKFQADITVAEISPSSISTVAAKVVATSRLFKGRLKDVAESESVPSS
ncbi:hypothetical protein CONLIGDRAFT_63350 [Coniochaeta ligniaria NRRL 30616]|uniref:Uncharacterized protein n=1 Tax=Coniochaeta ligniaria NRRL 30616 TaxID=1408157 RepID=A0A1J7J8A7_9PEZI|nr:hypothetical protein CONLIGDRAFT_63350 [Coniochaeta ligniaria NRRL 30616]